MTNNRGKNVDNDASQLQLRNIRCMNIYKNVQNQVCVIASKLQIADNAY